MSSDIIAFYFLNDLAGKSNITDAVAVFFAAYLQYFVVVALLIFILLSSYSFCKKIRIFLITTISPLIATGIKYVIRFFYHRPRPFVSLDVHKLILNGWFYSDKEWSFPSGHSVVFFAIAMAVYHYNKKWGIGFFAAAILINISRVIVGVHYPSDIVVGAFIGIIVPEIIFYLVEEYLPEKLHGQPKQ
jgi:undecaprenyl-diphosphatase